jgi:hypothetical protein
VSDGKEVGHHITHDREISLKKALLGKELRANAPAFCRREATVAPRFGICVGRN